MEARFLFLIFFRPPVCPELQIAVNADAHYRANCATDGWELRQR